MDNIAQMEVEARLAGIRRQKVHLEQLVELELEERRLMALQHGATMVCHFRLTVCKTTVDLPRTCRHMATFPRPRRLPKPRKRPCHLQAELRTPWT
jgi:hypothetical protein